MIQVLLCQRCWTSLRRNKAHTDALPPPLAICNNFAVVPLPDDIMELEPTWAELSVCARAQVAVRYVMKGRHGFQIRSHSLVFRNHAVAASLLPWKPPPELYFVVFAKLSDDEIASEHKSKLLVRKIVTDKLLRHYGNNIGDLYESIPYNHSFFGEKGEEEIVLTENSAIADESSDIIRDVDESSYRPGHVARLNNVEVTSSVAYCSPPRPGELPVFRVNRSSNLMNHRDRNCELSAFPHLHSNGLATVCDPSRTVHVAAGEARRHLLNLSLRTFAS